MSLGQKILEILDTQMETPTLYGWFHILWLALTAGAAILLCVWHRRKPDLQPRKVVFWISLVVVLLEIYKQVNFSFSYKSGISFDYQWYAFPFQFCSTPMYIGLLAGLTKPGKVHNALCAYLGTFALFAGLGVMLYPASVYIGTVGINIQTMICHGSMVVIGVYLLFSGYVKAKSKTILQAALVFIVCVAVAVALNEITQAAGLTEEFNMFFVSRHFESTLPVYSLVHNVVPFPINLLIYIFGFTAAAWIILLLAKLSLRNRREDLVSAA